MYCFFNVVQCIDASFTQYLLQIIRLWMLDFCIEMTNDYLIIFDGGNSSSQQLGQVSGCPLTSAVTTSGDFASSQRYMFIQFLSDSQTANRGFNATYSSTPGTYVVTSSAAHLNPVLNKTFDLQPRLYIRLQSSSSFR